MRPSSRARSQTDEKQPLITKYLKKKTERVNFYEQERRVEKMGKVPNFYPDAKGVEKLREEIDDYYEEIGKVNAKIEALKRKEKNLREKIVIRDKKLNAFRTRKIIEEMGKEIHEIEAEVKEMDEFYDAGEVENMEAFEEEYAYKKGRIESLKFFKEENEKQFGKELDEIDNLENALDENALDENSSFSEYYDPGLKQLKEY